MGGAGIHHAQRSNGARGNSWSSRFDASDLRSRLTPQRIPIKLEEKNRGCPEPRDSVAVPFFSSQRLGDRPIGRTPDSESGYPGSSPGLPAKLFHELVKALLKPGNMIFSNALFVRR